MKGSLMPFTQEYIKILEFNDVNYAIIDGENPKFWDQLKSIDAFIYHVGHTSDMLQKSASFMPILQNMSSLPLFPNYNTLWHFDDKIKQHYLAEALDLPFAKTWVFWTKKTALSWADTCEYPVVLKLRGGAGSTNVIKLESPQMTKRIIKRLFSKGVADSSLPASWKVRFFPFKRFVRTELIKLKRTLIREDVSLYWQNNKNYAYFQKFLPNNDYDTRVTVIGGRAFAFRRYNRANDFRASGSGKLNYDTEVIDKRMLKIALDTSDKCGFQSMAYDFLYDNETPVICEISYTYAHDAIYNCPGYWDRELNWHEGHHLPQYFILKDLLRIDLKHPKGHS
ncbi:MAG: hypothetical protein PHC50_01755 [Candidatus Cloacimonetes bacterium]|nr:hypothetical protein [Candidatus Cloacimonadota bacterium]